MKYTTALAVILALGPAANVFAAPVSQDVGSALSARTESPSQGSTGSPSRGQTQGTGKATSPVAGSSSEGSSGASSGSEGLLDKVEAIIKDVLGGVCSSLMKRKAQHALISSLSYASVKSSKRSAN